MQLNLLLDASGGAVRTKGGSVFVDYMSIKFGRYRLTWCFLKSSRRWYSKVRSNWLSKCWSWTAVVEVLVVSGVNNPAREST